MSNILLRPALIGYAEFEDRVRLEVESGRLPTDAELDRVIDARGCSLNVARIHLGDYRTERERDLQDTLTIYGLLPEECL